MAYVSKSIMEEARSNIKKVFQKYEMKGTLSGLGKPRLVLKLKKGKIDFLKDYKGIGTPECISHYSYEKEFIGVSKNFFDEVFNALMTTQYYNNSKPEDDYFDVSHYMTVLIMPKYEVLK